MKGHSSNSSDERGYTSVKELQQWLSQFGEKNKEHLRKGLVVKKSRKKKSAVESEPRRDLSIAYELQKSKHNLHELKSVSSASSHSTSVASPPMPMRTVNRLSFEPTSNLDMTASPSQAESSPQPVVATAMNEEHLSYEGPSELVGPVPVEPVSEGEDAAASSQWHVSKTNENECIRILAKVDPPVSSPPLEVESNKSTFIDATDSDGQTMPEIAASPHAEQESKSSSTHRTIRNKLPLLFCKSRRETKFSEEFPSFTKTVMVPNMKPAMRRSPQQLEPSTAPSLTAPSLTEVMVTESKDDISFHFDDYWNDSPSESSRLRLRQASPSMQDVSTSLVDVFEKEIQFEQGEGQSLWSEADDDSAGGDRPDSSEELMGFLYGSPSKSESNDTASSSISSKQSDALKTITPPRNEISDKIERFGGRLNAKKVSSIQERMAALESQWAKHKQAEHSKAVKWEALNGAYKRRIYLQTKAP